MDIFKEEIETKRVIFNVRLDLAKRLEVAKKEARSIGKKLDADGAIDGALEKFLKKAEKKIGEIKRKQKAGQSLIISGQDEEAGQLPKAKAFGLAEPAR